MLQPPRHVLPSLVNLPLLAFRDDSCRTCYVLLLDDSLALGMISLKLLIVLTCHCDHFESLLVLSLTPFVESLGIVTPEEHLTNLIAAFVLISGQLLIPGELANVLESTLPHRLGDCVRYALREVDHALSVLRPLQKDVPEFALVVCILRVISH